MVPVLLDPMIKLPNRLIVVLNGAGPAFMSISMVGGWVPAKAYI